MKTGSIRRILTWIGVLATVAALTICLAGCSQSEYVEVNNEKMGINELSEKIQGNELSVQNDLVDKEITVVAKLRSVESPGSTSVDTSGNSSYSVNCPNGYLILGELPTLYYVQLTDETKELATSLKKGETIKASGIFSGFEDMGKVVNVKLLSFKNGKPDNSVQPTIEVEGNQQ